MQDIDSFVPPVARTANNISAGACENINYSIAVFNFFNKDRNKREGGRIQTKSTTKPNKDILLITLLLNGHLHLCKLEFRQWM